MSRLHAKTNQIGKILHNLEKYNHMKEIIRSPPTPSSVSKSIFNKTSPCSPRGCPAAEDAPAHPSTNDEEKSANQQTPTNSRQSNSQQQPSNRDPPSNNDSNKKDNVDSQERDFNDKNSAKSDDSSEQSKCNGEVPAEAPTTQEQPNA